MSKQWVILHDTEHMYMNEKGQISRIDGRTGAVSVHPTDQWRVVMAIEYGRGGHEVNRYSLEQILEDPEGIPWKNVKGGQKTFIIDYDHGSHREWGCAHKVWRKP